MGIYLNPDNVGFKRMLKSRIYVDKTDMIEELNQMIGTYEPLVCSSRPRRFGKTMAVNMLTAYYSKGCQSGELFQECNISKYADFEEHLNKYDVIRLDMQWLMGIAMNAVKKDSSIQIIQYMQQAVIKELQAAFPCALETTEVSLPEAMAQVYSAYGTEFVVLIDEWDAVFRNFKKNQELQKEFIDLLRGMFKGGIAEQCIALAYITGILPVKKYGTESALNNFKEFTMTSPGWMAKYIGFTEEEVRTLCVEYRVDFAGVKKWYDGYLLEGTGEVYNPRSVAETMVTGKLGSHWTSTETYESLKRYIMLDLFGLKDAIAQLIAGNRIRDVNVSKFKNDFVSMESRDDVLTLLVHLGYLGYDEADGSVFIPNEEVKQEFENAIEDTGWTELVDALTGSQRLLEDTLNQNAEAVAEALERVHEENVSILNYNDENALSFVVSLAYYSARKDYFLIRELPTGKGFADIVFLPRKHTDKPAIVVELKWDKKATTAISQIKERHYVQAVENYTGKILMVGISYDRENKKHECVIEEYIL